MKMKRIAALLLACVLCLSMSACGGNGDSGSASESSPNLCVKCIR